MPGGKKIDSPILRGDRHYHNYFFREHEGLVGKTPAMAAGIDLKLDKQNPMKDLIVTYCIHVEGIYTSSTWISCMPKWKKDATEFEVSVTYHDHRGYQAYLPRPVMEKLGDPDTIKFVVKGKHIELEAGQAEKHD